MQDFLKTIAERCFEVLHPLSTYQRRHFALSVLQLMKSVFSDGTSASVCVDREKFSQLVTKAQYRTLVYTLWDTFDTNRSIAVELLLSLPTHFSGLQVLLQVRPLYSIFLVFHRTRDFLLLLSLVVMS